ncbi:MAG: hypothetical protein KGV51_00955 [Moraxellaceae bacterium]|nr:hypothetical protein [Moraxellaceae bacterium]
MKGIDVKYGRKIAGEMKNFPNADLIKIKAFENHVKQHGFDGLKGRNKSSANVPRNDPDWLTKVQYARQYNLWHYHIGIPSYEESEKGDMVSEYILHYVKGDDEIKLVDMTSHPPFVLPSEEYLE